MSRFHENLLQAISNKPDINGSIKEKPTAPIEARDCMFFKAKVLAAFGITIS